MRILIVDDHDRNRYVLRALLAGHGWTVDEARHGAEALSRGRASPPDLVVSDLLMPVMDGYTLLRHWKADDRLRTIPFVVYTATYTEPNDERLALDLGADAFILKPAEPDQFMERITEILAREARGGHPAPREPQAAETALLRDYSEVVVRKLEQKLLQLEQVNLALQEDIVRRQEAEANAARLLTEKEEARAALQMVLEDQRRAEAALRQNEERLRLALSSANEGLFDLDVQTGEAWVSPEYAEMLGYSPEDFHETNALWRERLHPDDRGPVYRVYEEYIAGQRDEYRVEFRQRTKSGAWKWILSVGKVVARAADGAPLRMLGAHTDITDRKRLEEERWAIEAQLRQQQKLEAIGTLAGGMAHEINNPINGIMNYAQLIADRLAPDSPLIGYTNEILRETERVATIVRNLLTFSRNDKQAQSPARMADILENTMSLVRTVLRHDQITLRVDVAADLPVLRCRSQQIQQVLMNLITNARDALNERYPGHDPDKTLELSASLLEKEGRPVIRVTVDDHGTGVTPEIRERMFEPFFTTKPRDKGTGLGLAISHGIVTEHRGEIIVESEPGAYTRVHVDLPLVGAEAT
jgi:two-component system, cell cycle sensor histidine kinase and response regulator CckA